MEKISVIGAGNVGATIANVVAQKNLCQEVVMLDIIPGIAEGKALDIWQTSPIHQFHTRVTGCTNDYLKTKGSGIVIITSGLPRKPGMSRDELIEVNAKIVKDVTERAVKYSPNAILIIVSNPLDVMTYVAFLASNKPSQKVFGMAGTLDAARYRSFISSALNVYSNDVRALLLGGHGDSMVPLPRYTSVNGIPVTDLLDQGELDKIVERTKKGGGELVSLMGTSAWYAPGAAAAMMVQAIVADQKRIFPVCAYLQGEYGLKDVYLGVPVKLGKDGIDEILEIKLNDEEKRLLHNSAGEVKSLMKVLDGLGVF